MSRGLVGHHVQFFVAEVATYVQLAGGVHNGKHIPQRGPPRGTPHTGGSLPSWDSPGVCTPSEGLFSEVEWGVGWGRVGWVGPGRVGSGRLGWFASS